MTVVAYESGIDMPPDALASKAQVGPTAMAFLIVSHMRGLPMHIRG
jgi:hypothetical protein